jgi:putative peptidoglycan lipid II flippase
VCQLSVDLKDTVYKKGKSMSTHHSIVKSAGIIGSLTGVSRVLGFVRDLVIATAFGTSVSAEAFVVSFKIPNLLRDLVGEGAANAAFVPVLTEAREKRPQEFWGLVSTLFFIMTGILIVLSALGMIFSEQVVRLIAPGFAASADPEKFPLTVHLTRVIFPYLFFIGLSALAMGVLNSLKEFTTSALGPVLLNISMIVAGVFFEKRFGPIALVAGVLAGGVLQLGCQAPLLLRKGFKITKPIFNHGSVKKIGKLLVPRALGSALYQINVFVDSILASFEGIVGFGGQSALYYSNRLFQLPLAIIGVSLAQALLPTFSTQAVREDFKAFKETLSLSLRTMMLIILPASAGLIVLAEPIIRIIFERGRFDAYSTQITSGALYFYAFGLLSCCFIKILVNAFYALQDTRTPVKTAFFCVALNVVLSLFLMRPLKIGGLALASSLSATVNAGLLYFLLRKRIGSFEGKKCLLSFLKMAAIASMMGGLAWVYGRLVLEPQALSSAWLGALWLALGMILSAGFYFGLAFIFRVQEIRQFFK